MVMMRFAAALTLLAACSGGNGSPPVEGGVTTPCTSSSDCPSATPTCDPAAQVCVGCIAGSCDANQVCDEPSHRCVAAIIPPGCMYSAECPRPGIDPLGDTFCEVDAGLCVACLTNSDCVPPATCQVGDGGMPACR
jgi:hypothetical protein